MDDTLIVCEEMDLNEILNRFNSCHQLIQFTLEEEANEEFFLMSS